MNNIFRVLICLEIMILKKQTSYNYSQQRNK
jgi:hypothetical protein